MSIKNFAFLLLFLAGMINCQEEEFDLIIKNGTVYVNRVQVLKNVQHTGAMPGMVVRGPGYQKE